VRWGGGAGTNHKCTDVRKVAREKETSELNMGRNASVSRSILGLPRVRRSGSSRLRAELHVQLSAKECGALLQG